MQSFLLGGEFGLRVPSLGHFEKSLLLHTQEKHGKNFLNASLFIPVSCRLASGVPKASTKAQTFFLLDSTQISPQLSLGAEWHLWGGAVLGQGRSSREINCSPTVRVWSVPR